MGKPDFSRFRDATPLSRKKPNGPQKRIQGGFLRGPVPLDWLRLASFVGGRGKAFLVGVALWYLKGLKKTETVRLTHTTLTRLQIKPDAARRGLKALERGGLVSVERRPGRAPVVTILDTHPEGSADDT